MLILFDFVEEVARKISAAVFKEIISMDTMNINKQHFI